MSSNLRQGGVSITHQRMCQMARLQLGSANNTDHFDSWNIASVQHRAARLGAAGAVGDARYRGRRRWRRMMMMLLLLLSDAVAKDHGCLPAGSAWSRLHPSTRLLKQKH